MRLRIVSRVTARDSASAVCGVVRGVASFFFQRTGSPFPLLEYSPRARSPLQFLGSSTVLLDSYLRSSSASCHTLPVVENAGPAVIVRSRCNLTLVTRIVLRKESSEVDCCAAGAHGIPGKPRSYSVERFSVEIVTVSERIYVSPSRSVPL